MRIKPNYIIIPLITVLVALLGGYFTSIGMPWYNAEIVKPELTPPRWAFPLAWNFIYLATTASALIVWNKGQHELNFLGLLIEKQPSKRYWAIVWLFIINALLNVFWTWLFFAERMIVPAFYEILLLEVTNIVLIILIWRISKLAALLLLPYAAWVALASYLSYQLMVLN